MKICPGCHRRYEDAVKFCPHDGIVLPNVTDEYVGRRLMDQFDILDRCGEGAMGTVYRARQINMDRLVAVKILRRDLVKNRTVVKRFYREAKAAARLSHPNIITVHLVAETDEGLPYIVMELLEGMDLDTLCKAECPLHIDRAVHLGAQIAAALSEAHRNDVVHRDLKPANIIVLSRSRPAEVVKVLDFGIAKILEAGVSDESRITKSGAIFGTPYYLSPEQATGAELDSRADLYSLGVILYRLMTGHLPFENGSGLEILVRHVKEPPPPPRLYNPSLPKSLEQVILTALEKDRDRRFQSADAMRVALLAAAGDAGLPAQAAARDPSSAWSAAASSDPVEAKKTVMGFSPGPASDAPLVPPPSPEADPLVYTARRLLGAGGEDVSPKPLRESKPTVLGGRPVGADGDLVSGGGGGSPAPRFARTVPSSVSGGTWRRTGESELDLEDLPGAGRLQSALSAPAPVPKLILDPSSGRVVGGSLAAAGEPRRTHPEEDEAESEPERAMRGTAAHRGESHPDLGTSALSRAKARAGQAGAAGQAETAGQAGAARASSQALPDSSPSMVTGQHGAPSESMILALRRASERGRRFTYATAALAAVALAVGLFFVIQDQRARGPRRSTHSRQVAGSDASLVASPMAADARVSEPALAPGAELVRVVDQGLVARLSCEQTLRASETRALVLDVWEDGRRRPVADAEATLQLTQSPRRRLKATSGRTGVVGRYVLPATFPVGGLWTGALEVRLPGGTAVKAPVRLTVAPRPGGATSPMYRPYHRPRDRPAPMDGLPQLPPDEGMTEPDRLPPPPMDPPVPPPDPD